MKRMILILSIFMLALSFAACSDQEKDMQNNDMLEVEEEEGLYPVTFVDKFGNQVVIKKEPERVISFSPELVEIMYAIDAGEKLIGRSKYCDYPEAALSVPDFGDLFDVNMEKVLESGPDLVILSSLVDEGNVSSFTNQGIPVLVLDADQKMDGVYDYIDAMGKVFNRQENAEKLMKELKERIELVTAKVEDLKKPSAYFVVSFGEYDSTATGDTFIHEIIEAAGAVNIAEDGTNWNYNLENLLVKDPDIVICSSLWDSKALLQITEGYKDLSAIKEGRLYEIDENIVSRQGPRMVEAIEVLAKIFHPEAF